MKTKCMLKVPLNRVEGDLEIKVEMEGDVVSRAWSTGTMFRGFENIMAGRAALDGLVITPRICGICSTAHLAAAAAALDMIAGVEPPPGARMVRNVAQITELLQSDMRQSFLTFMADSVNPVYRESRLADEAARRYRPFRGETVKSVIQATRNLLEIVAILGGQWPHSSYMVPGGIASLPSARDLLLCKQTAAFFRDWYEERILGCSLERWREVTSLAALEEWLAESPAHRESELGFFTRFCREMDLTGVGAWPASFVSYGMLPLPEGSGVRGRKPGTGLLVPAGFARGGEVEPFAQEQVREDTSCSWYEDGEGPLHPREGRTRPYASGEDGTCYSWAKAPRYGGRPAETGPLAEMVMAGHPLFREAVRSLGSTLFTRQLARIARGAELLPALEGWLAELTPDQPFYRPPGEIVSGRGFGLTQAARGALGHWVAIEEGRIERYQVITPTGWNGSPRDGEGRPGPWEQALEGTPVRRPDNPVELGQVVRSFDPCLVCMVHTLDRKKGRDRRA